MVDEEEKVEAQDVNSDEAQVEAQDSDFQEAEVVEEAPLKPVSEEEENDFVDDSSLKQQEEKKRMEAVEEEKKALEPAKPATEKANIDPHSLHLSPEDEGGEAPIAIPAGPKGVYEYDNPKLADIEKARQTWVKSYRIGSIVKISISVICLFGIILGWLIPTRVMGEEGGQTPLYIALACAGGALVIMILTSVLVKRRNKGVISDYFHAFYAGFDGYLFEGVGIKDLKGSIDDKISKEEFEAGKIFLNTHTVGSRDSLTFTYKGVDCALADAAGQEQRSDRSLATSFVGKYLRSHNHAHVSEDGVILYLKGNSRAIPPSGILQRAPTIEDPRFNVYGSRKDIDSLPDGVLERMESVHTDKLLVDVTISIQKGRTYFYLGYEDSLMVLPNKETFNPNYLIAYKRHLQEFLEIATLL